MSEHDWVSAGNPFALVDMLHDRATERKRQLLACALCRRFWRFLSGYEQAKDGIAVAERHADGLADAKALMQAHDRIAALRNRLSATRGSQYHDHYQALDCVALACSPPTSQRVTLSRGGDLRLPYEQLLGLLRDVFANPFRPPSLSADLFAWQGGTIVQLAQAAYDERRMPAATLDPARLAVLADALDDAGCADEEITSHLREPGPHVRGCWVVDLILGKG
jgi:hypothetical protein